MADDVEKVVGIKEAEFSCPKCSCKSLVHEISVLTKASVRRDIVNEVAIGNAFIQCPVCGGKKYFWI